jgi:hypothetical protein
VKNPCAERGTTSSEVLVNMLGQVKTINRLPMSTQSPGVELQVKIEGNETSVKI